MLFGCKNFHIAFLHRTYANMVLLSQYSPNALDYLFRYRWKYILKSGMKRKVQVWSRGRIAIDKFASGSAVFSLF